MTEHTDSFSDLPPPLRRAAEVHGRDMVALVYNSGMATEAAKRLVAVLGQGNPGLSALQMIAQAFNETSTALAKVRGWSAKALNDCEQSIELGFAQQQAIVGQDGKVIQSANAPKQGPQGQGQGHH